MKSFSSKCRKASSQSPSGCGFTLSFLALLMVLCCSCGTTEQTSIDIGGEPTAIETKQPEIEPAAAEQKPEPSNIVAKISDYVITREELEKRLITELRPNPYTYEKKTEPVGVRAVLVKMIAEKAMAMDAREQNYLEDKLIQASLKRFKEERLVNLLLARHLQGKVTVTDSEIDEKIKTNPKLNRASAKAQLERAKAGRVINEFYGELYKKRHVQKLSDNFAKAVQIRQRLLGGSKEHRGIRWVRRKQIENELTPEEKNIVLAAFDNGKVTLENWFYYLHEFAPPSRPKDLDTVEGVERLLDRAIRMPVFVAEARSRGLDKDENLLKQIRDEEDRRLLSKAMRKKTEGIKEPITEQEMIAYFDKNKQEFGLPDKVRIDQIWCQDIKTARQVKAELSNGESFEAAKQKYSLSKRDKPFSAEAVKEGVFFEDLWNSEPNEIVGPIKGFYKDDLKWRIVKVLGKTPGRLKEYSSDMKNHIERRIYLEQRNAILGKYRKELLEKCPYEIYAGKIKNIDPLNAP